MNDQARVSSIDALETFRASLIVFLAKARQSLDEVSDEVRRTRLWLQNDQRMKWEGECKRRRRVLDEAQQELLAARISSLREAKSGQQAAVHNARRALSEATGKLHVIKGWSRNFETAVAMPTRRIEGLRSHIDQEIPKAITHLVQLIRTLDAYAETRGTVASPQPGEKERDAE